MTQNIVNNTGDQKGTALSNHSFSQESSTKEYKIDTSIKVDLKGVYKILEVLPEKFKEDKRVAQAAALLLGRVSSDASPEESTHLLRHLADQVQWVEHPLSPSQANEEFWQEEQNFWLRRAEGVRRHTSILENQARGKELLDRGEAIHVVYSIDDEPHFLPIATEQEFEDFLNTVEGKHVGCLHR